MAKRLFTNPSSDNFIVTANFNPQKRSWLVWPERTDNWRLGAKPIQKLIVEIANYLVKYENITVLVSNKHFQNARRYLNEKVQLIELSTNDIFIKDFGPIFLKSTQTNEMRALISDFNAWGGVNYGVYYPWNKDNSASFKICELLNIDYYEIPIVLDWGMIILDDNGTCFASEEGIISEIKNSHLTKAQAENYLKNYLNVVKVIWIPYGLPFDQTKGRLDNIMNLADKNTILISWTQNNYDERYLAIQQAYKILKNCVNAYGEKYQVIKILLPEIYTRTEEECDMIDFNFYHNAAYFGQALVGSYTNFYLSNDTVLIPTFNDNRTEKLVLPIMEKVFYNKNIKLINCRELILGKSGLSSIFCFEPV